MNVMRTSKPCFNRRALATKALQAATATRAKASLDQNGPICVYGLCETLGIVVRFNNFNMEGMYQHGRPPRIHLSARRPLPRRAYNCAHELGHHVFGHGSSIDELREDAKAEPWEDPKEFLADTFAGFILMPISERTREGLAKARASGRKLGRPKGSLGVSRLDGKEDEIRHFLELGVSKTAIAKITGVSRTTLYSFMTTRRLRPSR